MKKKLLVIFLSIFALMYIIPVIVTIIKSLQYDESLFTLGQYVELLTTNYSALYYFWNSALYASVITVFCVILSFPLGFLFAKVSFPGRDALFFIYIVVMLLPFQATLLSNYIQLRDFKLLDTPYALMLPMFFSPFAVFLFRQFISGIPNDQLESTLLETSSVLKLLRYVVMPQLKEAFIALSVMIFCESWNMVEPAIIFASKNERIMPLSVVLTQVPENVPFACSVVYLYPVLIIYILFRDKIQKSMEKFRW